MQHAYSLGNIETSTRVSWIIFAFRFIIELKIQIVRFQHGNPSSRNYDSEDENVGRKKLRSISSYPKPSVYSKADIQEQVRENLKSKLMIWTHFDLLNDFQYCLSERQLNTINRSKRDGFFGCWSSHSSSQSFLSVCVGRRNPSDENLADSAPFYKHPRSKHFLFLSDWRIFLR